MATAILAGGLAAAPDALSQNVYRWVDDEGKVHYSKSLPPEAASRPHDILSSSGMLIKRVEDPTQQTKPKANAEPQREGPKPLYSEQEKKVIGDRLLLLKYRSEQDILDAMSLEIDHLKYDERLLTATYASVMKTLESQIAEAANLQRAGLEVDADLAREITRMQNRLLANNKSAKELEARKEKIRQGFQADLERYRELVADFNEAGSGS